MNKFLAAATVMLLPIFMLAACLQLDDSPSPKTDRLQAKVVKVIDGDTIKIRYKGKEENLRLLLIDTPELHHKQFSGPQPYAEEAKLFVEKLAAGRNIEFELGIQERDKYGRLLGYAFSDNKNLQALLLENGLARVAYIYNDTRYLNEYQKIEKEAQNKGRGIWSLEDYVGEDGYQSSLGVQEKPKPEHPADKDRKGCAIKGNINSKGEKIYHTPGSRWYKTVKPEVWFCNEQEAKAEGYRPPKGT